MVPALVFSGMVFAYPAAGMVLALSKSGMDFATRARAPVRACARLCARTHEALETQESTVLEGQWHQEQHYQ